MTSIDFDSIDQLYTVTANHWEPLDYISNVMQNNNNNNINNKSDEKLTVLKKESSTNLGATFIQVATIGATITGLILKIILPFLFKILPQYADIYQQLISNQVILLVTIIISTAIIILYTPIYKIAYPEVTQHAPIYTDRFKSKHQLSSGQQQQLKSSFQILPLGRDGGREVTVDEMKVGGSGSSSVMQGQTIEIEKLRTRYIINCAGCYSDKIASMIGDHSFKIKPRIGNYILLNRNQGHLARTTLFPCPHPVLGKGVLVQTTLWGNLILGPTARDMVSNVMRMMIMMMMMMMIVIMWVIVMMIR